MPKGALMAAELSPTGLRVAGRAAVALAVVLAWAPVSAAAGENTHRRAPIRYAGPGVNAVYSGHTAQGLRVRLGAPRGVLRSLTYQGTMRCSDGSSFTDGRFLDDFRVDRRGRFHAHHVSDRGATATDVRGLIRGGRATGSIRIVERYRTTPNALGNYPLDRRGTVVCRTGTVHWKARAPGRRWVLRHPPAQRPRRVGALAM